MPPIAIAAVGMGLMAGGTIYSAQQQSKANKANAKAAELDRKRMNLQSARERRDAIKASRLAHSGAQQTAENQGAAMTSSSEGGLGSIQSQSGSNLSFLDRYNTLTDAASTQIGIANKYNNRAQTGAAVANLGGTIFSSSDTIGKMAKVWGGS